jgi:hypothetical protein
MPDPKQILNYRQPEHDPRATMEKADRVLVTVALVVVVIVTLIIILSFA